MGNILVKEIGKLDTANIDAFKLWRRVTVEIYYAPVLATLMEMFVWTRYLVI